LIILGRCWGRDPAFFIPSTVIAGLFQLFFFLFLRTLLRKDWLAGLVWILVFALPDPIQLAAAGVWLALIPNIAMAVLLLFVQMRFGLVALTTSSVVFGMSGFIPMTLDASWYAGYGYATLLLIAALAFYGFRTSLGGRPLLTFSAIDTEASANR
jgi:hypothetical protein